MFFPLVGDLTCFRRLKRRHKGFKSNLLKSPVTNMPAEGRSAKATPSFELGSPASHVHSLHFDMEDSIRLLQ